MGWLDQVFATPVVGVETDSWMLFPSNVWAILDKFQDRLSPEKIGVAAQSTTHLVVQRPGGGLLELHPNNTISRFVYNVNFKNVPGKLPMINSQHEIMPYSVLLDRVTTDLFDLAKDGLPLLHLPVRRIGIVTECRLVGDELVPGVEALLEHLSQPWKGKHLSTIDATVLSVLGNTESYIDRCHHSINVDEVMKPNDVTFRLDWQRVWPQGRKFTLDGDCGGSTPLSSPPSGFTENPLSWRSNA